MRAESTLMSLQAKSKIRGRTTVSPAITRKPKQTFNAPQTVSRMIATQNVSKHFVPPAQIVVTTVRDERGVIDSMMRRQEASKRPAQQFDKAQWEADFDKFMNALNAGDMNTLKDLGIELPGIEGTAHGTAEVGVADIPNETADLVQPPVVIAPAKEITPAVPDEAEQSIKKSKRRRRGAVLTNPVAGVEESVQ